MRFILHREFLLLKVYCLAFLSSVSDQGEPQKLCPVLFLTGLAGGEAGANGGLHRCVDLWGTFSKSKKVKSKFVFYVMLQGIYSYFCSV